MAAAVGSLMRVSTCIPAAPAQSFVAWRARPLLLAGIVTTAFRKFSPRTCSASFLRRLNSMTAICSVRRFWPTSGTRSGVPRMRLMERMEALIVKVLLGLLAEGQGAVAAQRDDRGRPLLALVVGYHLRLAVLEVGHDRIAGAEVDADVGHNNLKRRKALSGDALFAPEERRSIARGATPGRPTCAGHPPGLAIGRVRPAAESRGCTPGY